MWLAPSTWRASDVADAAVGLHRRVEGVDGGTWKAEGLVAPSFSRIKALASRAHLGHGSSSLACGPGPLSGAVGLRGIESLGSFTVAGTHQGADAGDRFLPRLHQEVELARNLGSGRAAASDLPDRRSTRGPSRVSAPATGHAGGHSWAGAERDGHSGFAGCREVRCPCPCGAGRPGSPARSCGQDLLGAFGPGSGARPGRRRAPRCAAAVSTP